MDWNRLLAYITGSVDQELLLRNEYAPVSSPEYLGFMGFSPSRGTKYLAKVWFLRTESPEITESLGGLPGLQRKERNPWKPGFQGLEIGCGAWI